MDFFIGKQLIGQGIQLRFASPLFFGSGVIGLLQVTLGTDYLSALLGTNLASNTILYFVLVGIGIFLYRLSESMMIKQDLKELEENSLNEEVEVNF